MTGKKMKVTAEILGKSPDEMDSLMIANWVRRGVQKKKTGSVIL